jgi:hypothetical protein
VLMCVILANVGCMPLKTADSPDSGAICMTAEMYQKTIDESFNAGHEEARLEIRPRADVELNLITLPQLQDFLKSDQCDRCQSSVPSEDASLACLDRAECLTAAARLAKWDSYGVVLNFTGNSSHAIVAFPLKDGGIAYVEPWMDALTPTPPKVGERYYFSKDQIIEKIGLLR